jgi:putative hemolysin
MIVMVILAFVIIGEIQSSLDTATAANQTAAWCEAHNGTLVNSNSSTNGGLHCRLPNGTLVHPPEVWG